MRIKSVKRLYTGKLAAKCASCNSRIIRDVGQENEVGAVHPASCRFSWFGEKEKSGMKFNIKFP